jgi:hypothetical protein
MRLLRTAAAVVIGVVVLMAVTQGWVFPRTCTVGRVGTAMTETLSGPADVVTCDAWVKGNPKVLYATDEPRDAEHHELCQFHFGNVTRTVRDTGAGMWGAQRCQQLASGQQALS